MNYAKRTSRFTAFLIDASILYFVSLIVKIFLQAVTSSSLPSMNFIFQIALSIGYYVYYQHKTGQTIGKKVMRIKVVDEHGRKPTVTVFLLREILGKFISSLILGIGYLMILWDSRRQGLHDKIARTYVIKADLVVS